jgi:hypothetical protein
VWFARAVSNLLRHILRRRTPLHHLAALSPGSARIFSGIDIYVQQVLQLLFIKGGKRKKKKKKKYIS